MKKIIWIILAVLALAAVLLLVFLPQAGAGKDTKAQESAPLTEEGLPLDTNPSGTSAETQSTDDEQEPAPNIDPGTGMELEEDELPIATP